jgi:predicted AAA+ superfamily ATPase
MDIKRAIKDILVENRGIEIKDLRPRDIDIDRILKSRPRKITTLTGFRRVGKTYIQFLIMRKIQEKPCVYFNFEDERLPETADVLAELMNTIDEVYSEKPAYLFLDEIHVIPGWGKFLRRIHDRGYRIFVTGSSAKLDLQEIPTELRGRTVNRQVFPLSFAEYLSFKQVDFRDLDTYKESAIRGHFSEYLKKGGFPELHDANDLERKEIIQEYYRTLLQRDLIERYNLREEALLESLLKLVLNSLMVTITKLSYTLKSLGFPRCSKNTVANYLSYLEKSFFLYPVYFHSKNVKDRMQFPRKLYIVDNGFLRFMTLNPDEGRFLENLIALELMRRGEEIAYWRDNTGHEVDFIVFQNGRTAELIQACWSLSFNDTREREIRGLFKAMKHFGLKSGSILTAGEEETIKVNDRTIAVRPVWKWLLKI